MSAVLGRPGSSSSFAPWVVALAGIVVLYLPSYLAAATSLWQTDEFGHIPIIFVVALWLFWQAREQVLAAPEQPMPVLGWSLLGLGLLLYCFGRIFSVASVEFLSQPLIVASVLLLIRGPDALRAASFSVFYLIFMVPPPGTLVDMVTGPLKQWISLLVVDVLYAIDYPITRTGVMITIGQYQLLVADACSGLNSMFSLSALGTLFMYIMGRASRIHNAIMLAAILPIAFVANIVRVITLVLVTYHLGDEAGQGFLHGAAGMVLMLFALALLFVLDGFLTLCFRGRATRSTASQSHR